MQETTKSLANLAVGEKATIAHFSNPQVGCKLIAMGVAPQCDITIVRQSLLGNSLYVKSGTSQFAIRKKEAAYIFVK